jgi:DNA-binding response OmpR family regulator
VARHILSVSYDPNLLATRRMLLEQSGYLVTSALGFTQALAHCKGAGFDLFVLGHSIPTSDKQELIKTFRESCPAPILSLGRVGEDAVASDYHIYPDDPEELLRTISNIVNGNVNTSQIVMSEG